MDLNSIVMVKWDCQERKTSDSGTTYLMLTATIIDAHL